MTDKPELDLSVFDGHTPGPWKAHTSDPDDGHDCYEITRGGEYIASVAWQLGADATLIAAAPDLLAEVRRLREIVQFLNEENTKLLERLREIWRIAEGD